MVKTTLKWFGGKILELDAEFAAVEKQLTRKCLEIPHTRNILEISGIGENTLFGIMRKWETFQDLMMKRKYRN